MRRMRRCERGGAAAVPVAALLAGLLLLAGCTPTPAPTKSSAAPSPSATPLFRTDAEALAAAKESYQRFIDVSDEIAHDGGANPERIETVSTGDVAKLDMSGFEEFQKNGQHTVGNTRLAGMLLQRFAPASKTPVTAYVCLDYTGVAVVKDEEKSYPNAAGTRQSYIAEFVFHSGQGLLLSKRTPWGKSEPCSS